VTYYNTTGRPIMVSIYGFVDYYFATIVLKVNDTYISEHNAYYGIRTTWTAVVPPNGTYSLIRVPQTQNMPNIVGWIELR